MAKYSELQLTKWAKSPCGSEQTKLEDAETMVREAIDANEKLKKKTIETFGYGSYANHINARLKGSIDINVRYTDGFYCDFPKEKTKVDFGITPISYTYAEFKKDVENALVHKFGRHGVVRNDKCITIKENSERVETHVVPTWNYRRYAKDGSYVLGAKLKSDNGVWIANFPQQHIKNGINKSNLTSGKFKSLTRLHKKLRYKMAEDGVKISDNITSFLLECLVWNVPNKIFNDYDTCTDRLRESIIYLYNKTKEKQTCKEWGEVSELYYVFHSFRKWSYQDVNSYMVLLWKYLAL